MTKNDEKCADIPDDWTVAEEIEQRFGGQVKSWVDRNGRDLLDTLREKHVLVQKDRGRHRWEFGDGSAIVILVRSEWDRWDVEGEEKFSFRSDGGSHG